jgi:hypothetical protein
MAMSRREFLSELKSRGINVERQHVDHAIATGRLTCRVVGGWRVFGPRQIAQMEAYRRTVRAGRPRKSRHQVTTSCSS